jgi:hypothetical protein
VRAWLSLAVGGVLYATAVGWSAASLPPDGLPLHVTADGTVDRFGSRAEALTVWSYSVGSCWASVRR